MGLTSFLREAIDCYEKNSDAAWMGLEHAETQAQAEEQEDGIVPRFGPQDENEARTKSRLRTAKEMRNRLLEPPNDRVLSSKGIILDRNPAKCDDSAVKFNYKQIMEEQFSSFVAWVVTVANHDGIEITKEDLLEHFTPEQILSLEDDAQFKTVEREYGLFLTSKPDFETYLSRKMIDCIERITPEVEKICPIKFRQSIPDHLRHLIYEAQWCELFGLHAACAALCGAAIEAGVTDRLESIGAIVERAGKWPVTKDDGEELPPKQLLLEAHRRNLFSESNPANATIYQKADRVLDLRNDALHNPARFNETRRKMTPNQSFVADTLEALESIQERRQSTD